MIERFFSFHFFHVVKCDAQHENVSPTQRNFIQTAYLFQQLIPFRPPLIVLQGGK